MSPQRPQRGFTLVELLVVIVIIALLAALITPAVLAALKKARQTQISTELSQLHSAIEAYKTQYGSYPPSKDAAAFKAHLQSLFINIDTAELSKVNAMDNAQVLVFALSGYSDDKRRPLTGTKKPFFTFDPTRLDANGRYTAPNTTKPYVYFNCSRYPNTNSGESYTNNGIAKPYKLPTTPNVYANAKSFQIISSGLDNDYGADTGYLLNTTGIKDGHNDNVTNFSEGKPLIDYIDK